MDASLGIVTPHGNGDARALAAQVGEKDRKGCVIPFAAGARVGSDISKREQVSRRPDVEPRATRMVTGNADDACVGLSRHDAYCERETADGEPIAGADLFPAHALLVHERAVAAAHVADEKALRLVEDLGVVVGDPTRADLDIV